MTNLRRKPNVKNDSRCEKIQADCAVRAKLWQEEGKAFALLGTISYGNPSIPT
jgi:hypothetical protein